MTEDDGAADKKNLSHVPSWLMIGFLVGVITMWVFRREPEPPASPADATPTTLATEAEVDVAEVEPAEITGRMSLDMVSAIFSAYRDWVWWSDDMTQIAVWNSDTMGFTDRYEVIRTLEADYFRPIARFTRLPLPGYGPDNSPLLFTETAEQRTKRELRDNPDLLPEPERSSPLEFNTLPPPPAGD